MKLKHHQKRSFLFLFGVACATSSGVYFYVEQQADGISIALFLIGLISLATCFIYRKKTSPAPSFSAPRRPHWRKWGVVLIVGSLSCMLYAGVNYFAYSLSYRWDVTQARQHTLTASTIELIQGINKPVKVTALYVGMPPKYLEDLLKEYERVSNGRIETEIIDPIERIGYAAQFGNVINSEERKVIVSSGEERRDVDFSHSALTEEQLSNALVRVARAPRQACFLTGHGEFSLSNEENEGLGFFVTLLAANNVGSKTLMLGIEQSIPDDCDVLVIAGPRNELTEKEQGLVEDYLRHGGDALFLIENVIVTTPDRPLTDEEILRNPSLNSILNQWGVNVGTDVVIDLSSHVGKDVGSPATRNYMRHKAITEGLDYTFYVRPRSLSVLEERRSTIDLAPIVLTATKERSWAETNRRLNIVFDEGIDIPGPVPISFVIFEEKEEGDDSDTRIIVFTDADFLTNVYINQYSNAEMGLNIINWLSEMDYTVLLDQKEISVERLDLTSKQRRMIASILLLMPLFIAVGGLFVWIRQRNY